MKRFLSLALICIGFFAAGAAAQSGLTLQQAVALALEKNPVRKAAMYRQQAASAGKLESRTFLLPQVSFSEAFQRSDDPVFVFGEKLRQQRFSTPDFGLNALNTPAPLNNFTTRFSANWQLFDSGLSWFRMAQARRMSSLEQRRLQRTEQELIYRVIDAYTGVLLAEKRLQVAESAVKCSQAVLERSKARYDAGMVVESDYLSAQVDLASRQQQLIQAQNDVPLAHARLDHELGLTLDTPAQTTGPLAERSFPHASEESLVNFAVANRPDLLASIDRFEAQRKGSAMAKAAFGPRLNAFADWEADHRSFAGSGGNNYTAGVELQLDLFDGGAKLAQLKRQQAWANEAAADRDAMTSAVRLEVKSAYLQYDAAQRRLEVARAAVTQAKNSLQISQDRYDGGLTTITDLLRSEEAATRAESDYWQRVYEVQTTYANLELASGRLDANSPAVKP